MSAAASLPTATGAPVLPPSIAEAHAILTAPGARYEVDQVLIDGRLVTVWKRIPSSVRAFWLQAVREYHDRPYIMFENRRLTYGEIHEQASRLASVLHTTYSVQQGDRVAIAMRNCVEWIVAFWACHLVGAVSVQVNGWLPSQPFLYSITHTNSKVIIVDPERAARLAPHIEKLAPATAILIAAADGGGDSSHDASPPVELHPGMQSLATVLSAYTGNLDSWDCIPAPSLDDNATIFFTSGTTSLPKGVLSTQRSFMHGYMCNNFSRDRMMLRECTEGILEWPTPRGEEKTLMLGVPLMHVQGSTSVLMTITHNGYKLVLMRKWDPTRAALLARDEHVHAFTGVPTMILDLLSPSSPLHGTTMIESLGYGGAPAPVSLPELASRTLPNARMTQGWGMTETNSTAVIFQGQDLALRPRSTGLTVPCNETIIVDPATGRILGVNEVGELWIRGGSLMRGYWNDEVETRKILTADGWLKTGDLAYHDDERFLYISDRVKDMIIRYHCIPVEQAIARDPRIHHVAVVGVPDARLGEIVGALVVPRAGLEITTSEVKALCREQLAYFAVPEIVVIQQQHMARNAAGKIVKADVRRVLAHEYERRQRSTSGEWTPIKARL